MLVSGRHPAGRQDRLPACQECATAGVSDSRWGCWGRNRKPAKVKKSTIIAPVEDGGLGMVDTFSVHTAAKCAWIKRLLNNQASKWKAATWYMLNVPIESINKNIEYKLVNNGKTNFHRQVLSSWHQVSTYDPKTLIEIFLLDN